MKMGAALTPEQKQEVTQEIKQHDHQRHYGPVYLGRWGVNVIDRLEALEDEVAELKKKVGSDGR